MSEKEKKESQLVVGAADLCVFAGPATGFAVVKHLQRDAKVTVFESRDGWAKISESKEEWVLEEHLKVKA